MGRSRFYLTRSDRLHAAGTKRRAHLERSARVHDENPRTKRPFRAYIAERMKGKDADIQKMVKLRARFAQKPKQKRPKHRRRKGRGRTTRYRGGRSKAGASPNTRRATKPAKGRTGDWRK